MSNPITTSNNSSTKIAAPPGTPGTVDNELSVRSVSMALNEPSEGGVVLKDDDVSLQEATRRDMVETTLGDIEELCHDIEGTTVYSIRADVLKAWGIKLRNMLRTLRDEESTKTLAKGKRAAKAMGSISSLRRKASFKDGSTAGGGDVDKRDMSGISPRVAPRGTETHTIPTSVNTVGQHASGSLYVLLDALCQAVNAEWGTVFVYVAKHEELVLVASAGKKKNRPGGIRLSAQAGIEGVVLNSGVAVNVAHAYAEEEFSREQDRQTNSRTKATVVFPLFKPNNNSAIVGVLEVGNKVGEVTFSVDDEARVAECAQFISAIMCAYPGDITNPHSFDPQIFAGRELEKLQALATVPTVRAGTKIYRTKKLGHLRRQEVLRDAVGYPQAKTITAAMDHVDQMNASWKNAVMLNIELEAEIRRLHEALRISRRDTTRLQDVVQDLKRQVESAEFATAVRK